MPSRSPIIPSAHIPARPSNPHQDYSHTSCPCSHCLLMIHHARPQPPSLVISPVIPSDTVLDTKILDTGTFDAAMNVLTRDFNPIFHTEAAKEISNRHSYHLHGLLTILEPFYKINLFSSYYWGDAAKHQQLTKERVATSSVSTNTSCTEEE
ncbi:hypothetical protein L211DRAFT_843682 [Terfezia boudieri ATCC MYA-4762]|uniref:Uncharacterized protein n=1 Tax=Terfezia boudieri ATCC MYA-4762 TaxID=1051890 RepID=A0A3N4L732_9PEZI|nr:hypothetical protein L211DRAFT_843682 [Terfezia boudieri ATCC MYA-4762]